MPLDDPIPAHNDLGHDIQYMKVGLLGTSRLLGSALVALCSGVNFVYAIQSTSVHFNPNTEIYSVGLTLMMECTHVF